MSAHDLTGKEASDVALATQCRQLIRNVATPRRLRCNALAKMLLERVKGDRGYGLLPELLERALGQLSPRERAIIQRCDIDCEVHARVASDLGISKRHLYRKRKRILEKLVSLLTHLRDDPRVEAVEAIDSIAQFVKTSRVLEENGAYTSAAQLLERRAAESTDSRQRSRLFLRLAELHARNESLALADESYDRAIRHAAEETSRDPVLEAEASLTCALLADESAKRQSVVARMAERSVALVRSTGSERYDPAAAAILVRALSLRALAACFTGEPGSIRAAVSDIRETKHFLADFDADSHLAALYAEHLANVFCENDLRAAVSSLAYAMELAQSSGLSSSSIMAAVNLASIYRLRREPARAIAVLSDRLDVARAVGNRKSLASVLIELAGAHVDARDHRRAGHLLDEAASIRVGAPLQAALLRTSATNHLAAQRFADALEESEAAAIAYEDLGKMRLMGTTLRSQAFALLALGDRRGARRAIGRSNRNKFKWKSPPGARPSLRTFRANFGKRTLSRCCPGDPQRTLVWGFPAVESHAERHRL